MMGIATRLRADGLIDPALVLDRLQKCLLLSPLLCDPLSWFVYVQRELSLLRPQHVKKERKKQ